VTRKEKAQWALRDLAMAVIRAKGTAVLHDGVHFVRAVHDGGIRIEYQPAPRGAANPEYVDIWLTSSPTKVAAFLWNADSEIVVTYLPGSWEDVLRGTGGCVSAWYRSCDRRARRCALGRWKRPRRAGLRPITPSCKKVTDWPGPALRRDLLGAAVRAPHNAMVEAVTMVELDGDLFAFHQFVRLRSPYAGTRRTHRNPRRIRLT
jgi:hypothetical protein